MPSDDARAALLRAAAELIGEHGWSGVTTRAVAERAGVPHGAVSYHFSGKEDLLRRAALVVVETTLSGLIAMTEDGDQTLPAYLCAAGDQLLYPSFAVSQTATDYTVQGSESKRVQTLVRHEFPTLSGEQDVVVFESTHGRVDEPSARRHIRRTLHALAARSDVHDVVPPFSRAASDQVSADGAPRSRWLPCVAT